MLAISGGDEVLRALERSQKELPQDTGLNFVVIPTAKAAQEVRAGNGARAIELLNGVKQFEPGLASLPAIYLAAWRICEPTRVEKLRPSFKRFSITAASIRCLLYIRCPILASRVLYTLAANLPNARKSYQDFLAIWKDADPDIPILVQARREYAKLGSG